MNLGDLAEWINNIVVYVLMIIIHVKLLTMPQKYKLWKLYN